jgi:hypothetical protein
MIIILAYWLFLFALLLPYGLLMRRALKLETDNICLLLILGMLFLITGFTFTAFFFPLWLYPLIAFSLFGFAAGIYHNKEIRKLLSDVQNQVNALPVILKVALALLFIASLLKSAQVPFIADNESYYVQTIKWLNEYGFVKGLGNLHLFFAQSSPWHVLQAGLNFSFVTDRINDLNGFLFIICTFYYITEANTKLDIDGKIHWLGVMPVFSIILLLFTDTPSPDLPLLLITPILLYLYTETSTDSKVPWLLFLFIAFIKITIAPLGLLFISFLRNKKDMWFIITSGLCVATLWVCKNIILSGYPFYPFTFINSGYSWVVPQDLLTGINKISNRHIYGTKSVSVISKLWHWLRADGIAGLLNKVIVALFIVMPLFKKVRQVKRYLIIYIVFLIQFILLLFTSPQYRFFLSELLFFSAIILDFLINKFKYNLNLYKFSIVAGALFVTVLFLNLNAASITTNKLHERGGNVKLSQLYLPESNSKFSRMKFDKHQIGNLVYYSPKENFFLYGTANGPLPCVNKIQIKWIAKKFKYIPQIRSNNLEDGFYSAVANP